MPELPEVETIRRDLQKEVVGRTIQSAMIQSPWIVKDMAPEDFLILLRGKTIERIDRQAKYLLIRLSEGYVWVVHLMLEGQLLYLPADEPIKINTHMLVELDNGYHLRIRDVTGYVRTQILPATQVAAQLKLTLLGPEPIAPTFSFDRFLERFQDRKGMIKPLLLNQRIIAGVGNIYADEALYLARIHPARKVNTLSTKEMHRLYTALSDVIRMGIKHRGTTASGGMYRDIWGKKGNHQEFLQVFRRTGKPCGACEGEVVKTEIGGRSTFYCPACQPEP